jgi:hypothetical protein
LAVAERSSATRSSIWVRPRPNIDLTFGDTFVADGSGLWYRYRNRRRGSGISTWAMMLVGFAGFGFLSWRKYTAWAV